MITARPIISRFNITINQLPHMTSIRTGDTTIIHADRERK
jgi:hypothetical protein